MAQEGERGVTVRRTLDSREMRDMRRIVVAPRGAILDIVPALTPARAWFAAVYCRMASMVSRVAALPATTDSGISSERAIAAAASRGGTVARARVIRTTT